MALQYDPSSYQPAEEHTTRGGASQVAAAASSPARPMQTQQPRGACAPATVAISALLTPSPLPSGACAWTVPWRVQDRCWAQAAPRAAAPNSVQQPASRAQHSGGAPATTAAGPWSLPTPPGTHAGVAAGPAGAAGTDGQDAMALIRQRMLELAAKGQQAAASSDSRIPAPPSQPYQYADAPTGSPSAGPGFRYAAANAAAAFEQQAGGVGYYTPAASDQQAQSYGGGQGDGPADKPPSRGPTPLQWKLPVSPLAGMKRIGGAPALGYAGPALSSIPGVGGARRAGCWVLGACCWVLGASTWACKGELKGNLNCPQRHRG